LRGRCSAGRRRRRRSKGKRAPRRCRCTPMRHTGMSRVQTSARRGGMSGRPSCSRSTGIRSGRGGTGRPRSQIALPPRRSPGRAGRVDVLGRAAPDKGVAEASEPAAAPPACTGRRQECASRAGAKRRSEPLAAGGPAGPVGAPSWRRRGEEGRTPTSEPESLSGAILFVARARRRRGQQPQFAHNWGFRFR
jgi:hypothetical protein